MNLDRRQFARASSRGLALFAIPGWFAACQGGRREQLLESDDGGRTQLVLKVSDGATVSAELGEFFGIFLLHASDAQLAPLATCELTCAHAEELAGCGLSLQGVHAIVRVSGEAPVVALSGRFPYSTYTDNVPGEPEAEWDPALIGERFERRSAIQHAWIAKQLASVLGPGSSALARGCARERAAHGELPADARPSLELARTRPCLALERSALSPKQRVAWEAALAGVVRERWSVASPEGSSWVTDTGCGFRFENVPLNPHSGIACGMAFLAPAARRFLYFLTAEQRAALDDLIWPDDHDLNDDTEAR
ncbi:MAG: hypothetical protein NTV21_18325 [Planctomycetota bacterium]|nr:hypothetical protein [Planctomycetota bacterium]